MKRSRLRTLAIIAAALAVAFGKSRHGCDPRITKNLGDRSRVLLAQSCDYQRRLARNWTIATYAHAFISGPLVHPLGKLTELRQNVKTSSRSRSAGIAGQWSPRSAVAE
jgi:hypothetical protein